MSPFDLRKKMIEWQEEDDFSDKIWKEQLGEGRAAGRDGETCGLHMHAALRIACIYYCIYRPI